MSNSYLPEDLLVLVLIRLPPKFVGRLKSVSKSWNALISSSEFIRFHLQYQSSILLFVYRLLKLVDGHSRVTHLAEYSFNGRRDSENLEIGCNIQRIYNPYDVHAPGMTSMLVGSCNGLLCQILCYGTDLKIKKISKYNEFEISVWNPITKSCRVLPKSPLFLKDESRRVAFYGFGYDDVHDTYKVLLATRLPFCDEYEYRRGEVLPPANYEYEVYSLRSNSWVIVTSNSEFPDYIVRRQDWNVDGVLINYALHWILTNYSPAADKKSNYILAFDLRADKHYILHLPEVMENECNELILSELNGCLLIRDNSMQYPAFVFDMWVMKDYGLKESWTSIQILNSTYYLSRISPVALLAADDDNDHQYTRSKLIYHDTRVVNGTRLLSYDIESRQVVELPSPPSDGRFLPKTKQLQFVGSLVQPHPPSPEDNK